jgi:hypothetical protein
VKLQKWGEMKIEMVHNDISAKNVNQQKPEKTTFSKNQST